MGKDGRKRTEGEGACCGLWAPLRLAFNTSEDSCSPLSLPAAAAHCPSQQRLPAALSLPAASSLVYETSKDITVENANAFRVQAANKIECNGFPMLVTNLLF